jgi:1-acyl-sn-glycerol-3-phosphate acyltransferase
VWAKALCSILRLEVRVEGTPPRGAFLVASNHLSYLDIVVLGSLYPSVFVAKLEIGRWPFFGWVAKGAGTLFVDRDRPKDVVRAGKEMAEHLAAGIPLTIFPEGRSSRGESVLPFLPSLFEPAARVGVPCYSASIHYETSREDAPPSEAACWHGSSPFVPHIMGVIRHGGIQASVRFSDTPIRSSDRKELAKGLWRSVNDGFVPIRQRSASPRCAP